ncbi:MAG: Rab family GTPase [Candidatus Njordarchaeales archaeon]
MKVVFVGDTRVGKTSIIRRFLKLGLSEKSTLGVEVYKIPGDKSIIVWDTSGQPKFSPYIQHYLLGARVIVLVFDVSNKSSLDRIEKWAELIKKRGLENVHIILVGNKKDLGEQVSEEDVKKISQKIGLPIKYFVKTSALTGENINDLFTKIYRLLT